MVARGNSLCIKVLKSRYGVLGKSKGLRGNEILKSFWWRDLNVEVYHVLIH